MGTRCFWSSVFPERTKKTFRARHLPIELFLPPFFLFFETSSVSQRHCKDVLLFFCFEACVSFCAFTYFPFVSLYVSFSSSSSTLSCFWGPETRIYLSAKRRSLLEPKVLPAPCCRQRWLYTLALLQASPPQLSENAGERYLLLLIVWCLVLRFEQREPWSRSPEII